MTMLEVRDLSITFGGVQALRGVALDVEVGSVVGLIGPNGAGKTTLFECIAGFTKPTSGTVTFLGDDVSHWTPEARARNPMCEAQRITDHCERSERAARS